MANLEHVEVVKKGAEAIAEWRRENPGAELELSGADLSYANLAFANLSHADLSTVTLHGANLFHAGLSRTNLSSARLTLANLSLADLSSANLCGADIVAANFFRTNLAGTNFYQAVFGMTNVGACDLSKCQDIGLASHQYPSTVSVDTLIASFRGAGGKFTTGLEAFFLFAGVHHELLAELPRILAEVQYCSCFVCHGQPDIKFAGKLIGALRARGVSCWLYPLDYTPGERTWTEIIHQRRQAEKMIVLCSVRSLVRDGVLKEIEEKIDEDPGKMVPISLDGEWKHPGFRVMRGSRDLKLSLLERNYADFSDESKYEESMERLLRGLRRERG